jgi:hypothetical protein|tara:strand:- start:14006 stop:14233 length:228 start_codon:yes stop_codon:yes gene_type:complete
MPKFPDGKEFSYDKEGMKAAEKYAKKTGQQMNTYHGGGILNKPPQPSPYHREVAHSRGGGAARKDGTRFYKVVSD